MESTTTTTKNPMFEQIIRFMNEEDTAWKIEQAYEQRGGWEGWLQVELAIYLKKVFEHDLFPGCTVNVTREDYIYGESSMRSDILLKTTVNGRTFYNALELKCETYLGGSSFRRKVKDDCEKIDDANLGGQYRPCTAWVVAFSVTKDLSSLTVGERNLEVYPGKIKVGDLPLKMYWGRKDFK
ncbi:hypothetical protein PQX77_012518 [Marasmius sp. AFHP31]|nr:hypothetical protein PQX77_012518 [Marasmius sp. AFHP31]